MEDNIKLEMSNATEDPDYYDYDNFTYDEFESFSTFDWAELGPSLVVYAVTFVVGILGNALILVAVARHTHVKNSPVNVFLASLASADLLLIFICLPLKVAKLFSYTWTMGAISCKLLYYMQTVSCICSVLNLTALSIERYYVIVHPLKAQYLCTISKAKKTVVFTWISAFLLATPIIFVQVHMEVGDRIKAFWCVRDFDSPLWWRVQELYFLAVILLIPALVMGFSYGQIIVEVCRVVKQRKRMTQQMTNGHNGRKRCSDVEIELTAVTPGGGNQVVHVELEDETKSMLQPPQPQGQQDNRSGASTPQMNNGTNTAAANSCDKKQQQQNTKLDEETRQVVRMLIAIVITYVVCWGPLLIFNVLQSFEYVGNYLMGFEKHAKTVFSLMAYFNSCLNPIIYGFMSKSFRESFVSDLRGCCCRCCSKRGHYSDRRYSTTAMYRDQVTSRGGARRKNTGTTTNMLRRGDTQNYTVTGNGDGLFSTTEVTTVTTLSSTRRTS